MVRKIALAISMLGLIAPAEAFSQDSIFLKCKFEPAKSRTIGSDDRQSALYKINQLPYVISDNKYFEDKDVYFKINVIDPEISILTEANYYCNMTNDYYCISPSFEKGGDEHHVKIEISYSSIIISNGVDIGAADPDLGIKSYIEYKSYRFDRHNGKVIFQSREEYPQDSVRCGTEAKNGRELEKCLSGKYQKTFHPPWEIVETVQEGLCEESPDMGYKKHVLLQLKF